MKRFDYPCVHEPFSFSFLRDSFRLAISSLDQSQRLKTISAFWRLACMKRQSTFPLRSFLVITISLSSLILKAQWVTSGSNIYNSNSGNVGIGTTAPGQKLEVNGNLLLRNSTGLKSIYTWDGADGNWRIGMNLAPGFVRALATSHVQYLTFGNSAGQGFAVGVNGGNSSFEILSTNHQAFFRGNVGVGSTSADGLQVNALLTNENSQVASNVRIGVMGDGPRIILDRAGSTPFQMDNFGGRFRVFIPGTELFNITTSGNVGIGSLNPNQKLTVNGTIYGKEVKVDLNVPGPDYVFAKDYALPTLEQIRAYIEANGHLPEVPSASEMEQKGINLSEMNMLLLKKVEELTLYLIELHPSAFLNYILFDINYKPLAAQSVPVSATAGSPQPLALPEITAQELGYLFVYLSYDNNSGAEVHFDDFRITVVESPVIQVNNYYPFGMVSYAWLREGETENAYLYQGKELIAQTGWHDFGSRMYYADLGRWFAPDPQNQFSSPFNAMGNNPVMAVDPDGRLAWFIPVIIGAVAGGTAGGIIAHNNGQDWWKGAIAGAFIGAAAGLGVSAAIGPAGGISGITVGNSTAATAQLSKAWGITSSAIQSANVNMAMTAFQGGDLDNIYKSGIVGAASGLFSATGGFGLAKKGIGGRLAYQGIGTSTQSIGNNWAAGRDPFSRVTVGVGPVNLTFGKGQQLLQWQNNLGNIAMNSFGLLNTAFGGRIKWDWNHLTPVYKGGLIDKFADPGSMESGFSPFVVTGNSNVTGEIYAHELHHVWQSRSMGDSFALNYVSNGFFGMILNRFRYFAPYSGMNYPAFISPTRNYWETIPDFYPWW